MEHVLMLGNGFDLYYKLPTKYNNFLQISVFLNRSNLDNYNSLGDILTDYLSAYNDSYIKACYYKHRQEYDNTQVPVDKISELHEHTQSNIWFQYLLESYDQDVGWIDFEKEISKVIHALHNLLSNMTLRNFSFTRPADPFTNHIIKSLPVFFDHKIPTKNGDYLLQPDYAVEYPQGSRMYVVNKNKIISRLSDDLIILSEALKLYLSIFVESILPKHGTNHSFKQRLPFRGINRAITFNYTHTYERVYLNNAHHLHGSTDRDIVLGINPDKFDEIENADTLCITFKKYYQRVMYRTDTEYLSWITGDNLEYTLMIMGHSLDVTDADIIKELFSKAKEITIIYHNYAAESTYIENIIRMYGYSGFDRLRKDKKLKFMHLNEDFSKILESREKQSLDGLIQTFFDQFIPNS